MNSNIQALRTQDVDGATIDGATVGITPGHGVLASMMSWIRGALTRPSQQGEIVAGVPTPDLSDIDPQAGLQGTFDPAVLMNSLQRYSQRYGSQLAGAGLVLTEGSQLPPSAFPAFQGLAPFGGAVKKADLLPYSVSERTAALKSLFNNRGTDSDQMSVAQLAWLANAIVVRSAIQMAPFVHSTPVLIFTGTRSSPTLHFAHAGENRIVSPSALSSPLSLHRTVREGIQDQWQSCLAQQTSEVSKEFYSARAGACPGNGVVDEEETDSFGLPKPRQNLAHELCEFRPFWKMRYSSAAFIDIQAVSRVCFDFVDGADRIAIRNALRHGTNGLNWTNYLTHCAPETKSEIAKHEHLGALAYAKYTPEFLKSLDFLRNEVVSTLQVSTLNPLLPPGSVGVAGAGTAWALPLEERDYKGTLMAAFMEAMESSVNGTTRAALAGFSPRYLSILVRGTTNEDSFESFMRTDPLIASNEALGISYAKRAGHRLAGALNKVCDDTQKKRNCMPWSRVLASDTCYELMLSPDDKRSEIGLVNLILYANSKRSKGDTAFVATCSLPDAEECMSAAPQNVVGSLLARHSTARVPGWRLKETGALNLVRDFLSASGVVSTTALDGGDVATNTTRSWLPHLVDLYRPDDSTHQYPGGFTVGLLDPAMGKRGSWSLLNITGRTDPMFDKHPKSKANPENYSFSIRGPDTPDSVPALVMTLHMPGATTLMDQTRRNPDTSGVSSLRMTDIHGDRIKRVAIAVSPPSPDTRSSESSRAHLADALRQWAEQIHSLIAQKPFESAALFPAVAKFILDGGHLSHKKFSRQIGTATGFKLARACLGSGNHAGMHLICSSITRPDHRSASGISLLDLALDATDIRMVEEAIHGLQTNFKTNGRGGLARMIQQSMGKLTERHPDLIPLAIRLGGKADHAVMSAWRNLHPNRQKPQIEAALNGSLMMVAIEKASSELTSAVQSSTQPRRRTASI